MGYDARTDEITDDPVYIAKNDVEVDEETVLDMAYDNIDASLSKRELVRAYLDTLDEGEIFRWAADDNGEFHESESVDSQNL